MTKTCNWLEINVNPHFIGTFNIFIEHYDAKLFIIESQKYNDLIKTITSQISPSIHEVPRFSLTSQYASLTDIFGFRPHLPVFRTYIWLCAQR